MKRTAIIGLLVAANLFPYSFYTHYPVRGQSTPVYERFDLSAQPSKTISFFVSDRGPDVLAPGDSFTAVLSEFQMAARAWSGVSTAAIKLQYGGLIPAGTSFVTPDIEIVFDEIPPGLIAQGFPSIKGDLTVANGTSFIPIQKSIIRFPRDLSQLPSWQEQFFIAVIHEFGHAMGLQHTLTASAMSVERIRSVTKAKPLEWDDVAGLSLLYPAPGYQAATGSIRGRITANGNPVNMANVVALTPTGPALSVLTAPDGTYRIDGLTPGQYTVYAQPLPPPLIGERYPANITPPIDFAGRDIPAGGPFTLQYFPGVTAHQQASPVAVSPGATTTGIDFRVANRSPITIYALETYGFPANAYLPVKPPIFPIDQSGSQIILAGEGIFAPNNKVDPIAGLRASVFGESQAIAAPGLKPSYTSRYLALDLVPNAPLGEGARHLILQNGTEQTIQPGSYFLVRRPPPSITSISPSADAKGNRGLLISGTNFTPTTRFYFDGIQAPVLQVIDAATTQLVQPPAAPAGYRAIVTALNDDRQSSMHLQQDNPPNYTFPSPVASASPTIVIPQTLSPGVESLVEIDSIGANFVDGTVALGFGTPDIQIRHLYPNGPNQILANVVVPANAPTGTFNVTVVNGLQTSLLSGAFQIVPRAVTPFSLSGVISNAIAPALGVFPGATVAFTLASQPYALAAGQTMRVTFNGVSATIASFNESQLAVQVPQTLTPGLAVVRLQVGSDTSLPILAVINAAPAN